MKISVTLSANAGVAINFDGHRVWVDALHNQKVDGFSAVCPSLQKQMMRSLAFSDPGCICYTHCHPDHFSEELTASAKALWPEATLYLPEQIFQEQILVQGQLANHREGQLNLHFFRLPHEGAQYAGCVHYGILLSLEEKHILIPGDCQVAADALARAVKDIPIDLALLNFPWATLKKGHSFVREVLRPKQTLLYHLPFEADDINGFRQAAEKALTRENSGDMHLLWNPLQTIDLDI